MSESKPDRKAGHPPAVKAGGMRVVTKHKPTEKPDTDAFDQKYIDQLPESSNIAAPISSPVAQDKTHQDNAAVDAVKQAVRNKQPTVEKPHSQGKAKQINQPRK